MEKVDVHKIELYVIEFSGWGVDDLLITIENALDTSSLITLVRSGDVITREIEWTDEHPCNISGAPIERFREIFE